MKLFFIVGEDSGDVLAASMISQLKNISSDIECLGIGGPRMKAAGFNVLLPMDQIAAFGVWEVIPKIPHLLKVFKALLEEIEKQKPDAVITVDFPDFNFRVAQSLKKQATKAKLIHYVAPSVWAWRPGRAKHIAGFLDGLICLFPMETSYFTAHGLKTICAGHSLIEEPVDQGDGQKFKETNSIKLESSTLGLFFGSRESEFKNMGKILCQTALIMHEVQKDIHIIIPTLPKLEYDVQKLLQGFPLPVYISANPLKKWDTFKACDVAVAVSGTVALELAYAGVPHVIAYKTSPPTYALLKTMVKVKHAHLANILLEQEVVPEFIQDKCMPEAIAMGALNLIKQPELRQNQKEQFVKLRDLLGAGDPKPPSQKAAEFVLEIINGRPTSAAQ